MKKTPEQLWSEAQKDSPIAELNGIYAVKVLTGPYRALNVGRDRKHIKDGRGYNVIFGVFKWGHFRIESLGDDSVVFNYDGGKIADIIRKVSDNEYIGQLYVGKKPNQLELKGYFILKKSK